MEDDILEQNAILEDIEISDEMRHLDLKTIHIDNLIEETFGLNSMIKKGRHTDIRKEFVDQFKKEDYDERLEELAKVVYGAKKKEENERELIKYAIHYAIEKYSLRRRKRGELFFQHSLRVANKISNVGGNIETIVGGILHDVIEEDNTYRRLKKELRKKESDISNLEEEVRNLEKEKKWCVLKRRKLSRLREERRWIVGGYKRFKERYLKNIREKFSEIKGDLGLKFDVGSVVDIVDKLTKDIHQYYYKYQKEIFASGYYGDKRISKKELTRATGIIIAKGCDREDNTETMGRLEDGNSYSFSTYDRLSAINKNITTINRMRNFLDDHHTMLTEKLHKYHQRVYDVFGNLREKTKEQLAGNKRKKIIGEIEYLRGFLDEKVIEKYEQIEDWNPIIKEVIEKYDLKLHYDKVKKSKKKVSKKDVEGLYRDCLAFEKILDRFKKRNYNLNNVYKGMKDKYENGNK